MLIETGIIMPEPRVGNVPLGQGAKKYPFEEMEIGDSFLVDSESAGQYGKRLRSAVAQRNNRNNRDGRKFVVRSVEEGFRCWRVE